MANIIKRFLKLLKSFGIIKRTYTFEYVGKGVSLNQYYSQQHWTQRQKIKVKYSKIGEDIISKVLDAETKIDKFALVIFYWSKHDPDNVSGFEKVIMDRLKERGNIVDDNRNYYKLFAVIPDESLLHNTFKFVLIEL